MLANVSYLPSQASPVEWVDTDRFITYSGCNIAVGSARKPTDYQFLEGHSTPISTFAYNREHKICVSGQSDKESHQDTSVPAIVWDIQAMAQVIVLRGHTTSITHIAISDDARIVAIADKSSRKLWIWDLQEQDLACYLPLTGDATSLRFGGNGSNNWLLHVTVQTHILEFDIKFDHRTFEYRHTVKQYANPTTGYRRTYSSSAFFFPYLFVGTKAGEVAVYHASSTTLRTTVEIDSFSISSISVYSEANSILVGGKQLSLISGDDKNWHLDKSLDLGSSVISISCINHTAIVRTENNSLFLVDLKRFTRNLLSQGLPARPIDFACGSEQIAIALGEHGLIIAEKEASLLHISTHIKSLKASAVCYSCDDTFIVGNIDGTLSKVSAQGDVLWSIERIHRGKITALCSTNIFIATGGEDGMIRIITHKSHSIVNEILAHSGPVLEIIQDVDHPERVHSVSADRTVNCSDISTGKRVYQQLSPNRMSFTSLIQLRDGEKEILASMGDGTIKAYDWPRQGIIFELKQPRAIQINSISLHPKQRLLACGGECENLYSCDIPTQTWTESTVCHSTVIRKVAWMNDGQMLVSIADDGVCLWKL